MDRIVSVKMEKAKLIGERLAKDFASGASAKDVLKENTSLKQEVEDLKQRIVLLERENDLKNQQLVERDERIARARDALTAPE